MKTTQIMKRKFDFGIIRQNHKTGFFCLNDILDVGNKIREAKGLRPYDDVYTYTRSVQCVELLQALAEEGNEKPSDMVYLPKVVNSTTLKPSDFLVIKKGRYGGTWGYPLVAVDMAMRMDAKFKIQMLNAVFDQLLYFRDASGDAFKDMNVVLDSKFNIGSDWHKYAKVAKFIQMHVFGHAENGQWNTANKEQLADRERLLVEIEAAAKYGNFNSLDDLLKAVAE